MSGTPPHRFFRWLAVGVLAWGTYLAVGAYQNGVPIGGQQQGLPSYWRPVVVLGFVAASIAWWLWLARLNHRRRHPPT